MCSAAGRAGRRRCGAGLLRRAIAVLVAIGVAPSAPAAAQGAPPPGQAAPELRPARAEEDSLVRRLREIERQLPLARSRADAEDARILAARREAAGVALDSLTVGPLRIFAEPDRTEEARDAFGKVWSEVEALLGEARELPGATFLFDPRMQLAELSPALDGEVTRVTGRNWDVLGFDRASLLRAIRVGVGRVVVPAYPQTFAIWVGGNGPLRFGDEDDRARRHRLFVLARAPVVTSCVEGDLDACWDAVGLRPDPAAPDGWYDDRRLDEEGFPLAGSRARRAALARWHGCRGTAPEVDPCARSFLGEPRSWIDAIPVPASVRSDLVVLALELGGAGALGRLLDRLPEGALSTIEIPTSDSTIVREGPVHLDHAVFAAQVRNALVAAAGVPEDELMERWRASVLADRPENAAADRSTRIATTFWIFLLSLAATRSTRWRLG